MSNKPIFGTIIFLGLFLLFGLSNGYSQTLSKEEQKLMQNQMKDSLNSEKYLERQANLAEMLSTPPKTCGLESIDGLAINAGLMIVEQQKTTELLNTYVGQLTSDEEGEIVQSDGKKVSAEDILQLSTSVANQLLAVSDALLGVTAAAGDISQVSKTKIGVANKSLKYTKDALTGVGTQLKSQSNILKQIKIYNEAVKNQ